MLRITNGPEKERVVVRSKEGSLRQSTVSRADVGVEKPRRK